MKSFEREHVLQCPHVKTLIGSIYSTNPLAVVLKNTPPQTARVTLELYINPLSESLKQTAVEGAAHCCCSASCWLLQFYMCVCH